MKTLLDPKTKEGEYPFKYVPALRTNVRETIERARRELADRRLRDALSNYTGDRYARETA